jgi:hypothetical protein
MLDSAIAVCDDRAHEGPALDERENYIDDLWFLLHHSEDENELVIGLTSYLDDSGSDDGSKIVTIGGPVMSRIQFKAFSKRWDKMLAKNRIESPLHMSDFMGMGKYASMAPEFKRALFLDVCRLVREHKQYSLSVAIAQPEFRGEFGEAVSKNLIGPYAFAFFTMVAAHQTMSQRLQSGPQRVSYLVDLGFGQQWQLGEAHGVIVKNEKVNGLNYTGALAFDSDDRVPALQAADVIAWTSRQRELRATKVLPEGFEPLSEVIGDDDRHAHIPLPTSALKMLSEPINKWISKNGGMPSLMDVIRQSKV